MDKKEAFKAFIKTKPDLVTYIKNNNKSMQELFEIYDIYGDNNEVWDKYVDSRGASLSELTALVKNINMDNMQKYINNAQKAINVIQELTSKGSGKVPDVPSTPRPITKFFGD